MCTDPADFRRLTLLVQRILDADALADGEGDALLTQAEAAGRALVAGDMEAAHRRVEQVARLTEDLVRSEAIVLSEGSAILEMAQRILAGDADGFTPLTETPMPL